MRRYLVIDLQSMAQVPKIAATPAQKRRAPSIDEIERGLEVGNAGLTFLERLVALFRPNPEKRASRLRNRAENKREKAADAKSPARRKRLLSRAGELDDKAEKLAPSVLVHPPLASADADELDDTQGAGA